MLKPLRQRSRSPYLSSRKLRRLPLLPLALPRLRVPLLPLALWLPWLLLCALLPLWLPLLLWLLLP